MSLDLCHLRFIYVDVEKTVRKRAQIWDRCSLEYFVLSRFYLRGLMNKVWREFHFNKYKLMGFEKTFLKLISLTIILCLFTWNISSKHREGLSTQQHWSNLHNHHFSGFGQKLFRIVTVGTISLGNCRFYCPRSFQSIERLYMFTVIVLNCLKNVFKIALKPASKGIACE